MDSSVVKIRRWVLGVAVAAVFAGGALLSQGIRDWAGHSVLGSPRSPITVAQNALPVSLGNFANGFSAVIKPALPAVVNIRTSKIVKPQAGQMNPMFNDPMFRQFFGDQFGQGGPGGAQPKAEREQALGSGVIVTADGTILTNNHVIDGATDIKVQLNDKREYTAKLVGADAKTDIAVLKIEAKELPTLPIGDSGQLNVGDLIFAIGDPFGIGETATMGIVSATGRANLGIENYENFIQTDAAINPGNSGGAMIDIHGNLVGINTAILSHGSGGNEGVGFAIPMSMVKPVMDQILSHGKVVRGYLGILPQDVTPELAKAFNYNQPGGVLIGNVKPDTPAAKAGLKQGDVITALNGTATTDRNTFRNAVAAMAPGTSIKLDVWRDGKTQPFTVTLTELPPDAGAQETPADNSSEGGLEGVNVQPLTADIAGELKLPANTKGVVITSVDDASPAAAAGLNRGDVIQEVNHKPVSTVAEYKAAVAAAGKQPLLLLVNEGGITRYVVVEGQ
jgi:serine protease Do